MAAEREMGRPSPRSAAARRKHPDKEAGWSVEFEINSTLRVTDAEIQVLETYLGRQLDALFGNARPSRNDMVEPGEATNPPMRKRV